MVPLHHPPIPCILCPAEPILKLDVFIVVVAAVAPIPEEISSSPDQTVDGLSFLASERARRNTDRFLLFMHPVTLPLMMRSPGGAAINLLGTLAFFPLPTQNLDTEER